ncbi:MAG: DUF2946 family protein [Comamonas sp.]
MDDIVKQAMAKWPNVPACYGWLGLDGRGQWWLRDAEAQARGTFCSGADGAKGSRVRHDKLADFIARNYLAEPDGRWFFQNGPQRVYVELQLAPWVWRLRCTADALELRSHTGELLERSAVRAVLLDEEGQLYLHTDRGLGSVHTQDMLDAATALDLALLPQPELVERQGLAARFGFVRSPQGLAQSG